MKKVSVVGVALVLVLLACVSSERRRNPSNNGGLSDYFSDTEESSLSPSEKLGREIWYKATAGNARYHTYVLTQRLIGANVDFGQFLGSQNRSKRFDHFGLINDPDCCTPGESGCPAKSLEETFGMDYCPGDEKIYAFLSQLQAYRRDPSKNPKPVYRDPACDLKDPSPKAGMQNPCDLEFGQSIGALGFRKLPNPRFDSARWKGWEDYGRRLRDQSIEPPFLVGVSCGSCHISFNPTKPPEDPNAPKWENIKGLVGNQYLRNALIFGSGAPHDSLEWHMFRYDRAGSSDTSAVANDQIYNPGTINAIINLSKRPRFRDQVKTWRQVPAGSCDEEKNTCQVDANGKYWQLSTQSQEILHILKGGEDSIGPAGAVQRVYINIGSCAESCWLNHTPDLRVFDPTQRNFGETPFDIAQCRRDCPQYRAVEDRVGDVFNFFLSAKQMDLHEALGTTQDGLGEWLESKGYEKGAIGRGRELFKQNCAECHSSKDKSQLANVTFTEMDEKGFREDWLGSDALKPVTDIKTFGCRALHTNHNKNHVWQAYASETFPERTKNPTHAPALKGVTKGGPGYYRSISLLNSWAFAPFMHNNAIGPEVCPKTKDPKILMATEGQGLGAGAECNPFPVSVEERFKIYEASMNDLLNPAKRTPKITKTDAETLVPLLPGYKLQFPKGIHVSALASFDHKEFLRDLFVYSRSVNVQAFKASVMKKYKDAALVNTLAERFAQTIDHFKRLPGIVDADPERLNFYLNFYTNCNIAGPENSGHEFGKDLSDQEKKDLTAFLASV